MISSASSMRAICSATGGQSMPHGDSFSDSPEPMPRNARPGHISSIVAMNCATVAGLWRNTGAVTPVPSAGDSVDGPDRPEQRPRVARLAGLPPRLEVVRDVDAVEAGPLGRARLLDQGARRELLRCQLNPIVHQPSTPVDECGEPTGFDSGEPRWRR